MPLNTNSNKMLKTSLPARVEVDFDLPFKGSSLYKQGEFRGRVFLFLLSCKFDCLFKLTVYNPDSQIVIRRNVMNS